MHTDNGHDHDERGGSTLPRVLLDSNIAHTGHCFMFFQVGSHRFSALNQACSYINNRHQITTVSQHPERSTLKPSSELLRLRLPREKLLYVH